MKEWSSAGQPLELEPPVPSKRPPPDRRKHSPAVPAVPLHGDLSVPRLHVVPPLRAASPFPHVVVPPLPAVVPVLQALFAPLLSLCAVAPTPLLAGALLPISLAPDAVFPQFPSVSLPPALPPAGAPPHVCAQIPSFHVEAAPALVLPSLLFVSPPLLLASSPLRRPPAASPPLPSPVLHALSFLLQLCGAACFPPPPLAGAVVPLPPSPFRVSGDLPPLPPAVAPPATLEHVAPWLLAAPPGGLQPDPESAGLGDAVLAASVPQSVAAKTAGSPSQPASARARNRLQIWSLPLSIQALATWLKLSGAIFPVRLSVAPRGLVSTHLDRALPRQMQSPNPRRSARSSLRGLQRKHPPCFLWRLLRY
mmetsp:Transcript_53465/g.96293  ORF Transcript_53465/g.96293 Transcript_53465/m.96293 type:complete len:365 (-) Transcript_53465:1100-2194(-)